MGKQKEENKSRNNFITILVIALLILIFQLSVLMIRVHHMQGNARVVNYTGIVRGATQRLIKNELYNIENDKEIQRLDSILYDLQNEGGEHNLTVLKDDEYIEKLTLLSKEWEILKQTIYEYRKNPKVETTLYNLSEKYFNTANDVVNLAEKYSDGIAKSLPTNEITISLTILFMLFLLFIQLFLEVQKNRKLNTIAYIDSQTSLPNKRGCEEKMNEKLLQSSSSNVCCVLFDINNLKYANDTYGHLVGDALIMNFASLLRSFMPEDMFVGRFGGDEFIGIQECANKEEITQRIEQLQEMASYTTIGTQKVNMTISFAYGLSFSKEEPGLSIKELMEKADKRMYENKSQMKKNRSSNII